MLAACCADDVHVDDVDDGDAVCVADAAEARSTPPTINQAASTAGETAERPRLVANEECWP
eukprot:3989213-Lingulodinium_polyedra.AAC.1